MKKILITLTCLALVGCCTTDEKYSCGENYRPYNQMKSYKGETYTVSKPVEVIYRNVTYTTIYEPKTYTTTSYERRPYRNECRNGRTK